MPKRADLETRKLKRELLHGLRGEEREAQKLWMDALERAGLPVWLQWGRTIGPRDIEKLRERLADDPATLAVLENAHRASTAEFLLRLPLTRRQTYRDELLRKDPSLYGPLFA